MQYLREHMLIPLEFNSHRFVDQDLCGSVSNLNACQRFHSRKMAEKHCTMDRRVAVRNVTDHVQPGVLWLCAGANHSPV